LGNKLQEHELGWPTLEWVFVVTVLNLFLTSHCNNIDWGPRCLYPHTECKECSTIWWHSIPI